MSHTGVTVNDELVKQFNLFKLQKEPYNYRYYIYKTSEDCSQIIIDKVGERSSSYQDFVSNFPQTECRYGLYDLDFQTMDGRPSSKLVFLSWTPSSAKVKDKMMYAGSKECLKAALVGVSVHLQATDISDLDIENVISHAQKL